jgi:hypothetical protein
MIRVSIWRRPRLVVMNPLTLSSMATLNLGCMYFSALGATHALQFTQKRILRKRKEGGEKRCISTLVVALRIIGLMIKGNI